MPQDFEISPGILFVEKAFSMCLFVGGRLSACYRGGYYRKEFCVPKVFGCVVGMDVSEIFQLRARIPHDKTI